MQLEMPMYTAKEFGRLIGRSRSNVYYNIANGELDAVRDVNGQLRIPMDSAYKFISKNGIQIK
jgi:hypothetical protein